MTLMLTSDVCDDGFQPFFFMPALSFFPSNIHTQYIASHLYDFSLRTIFRVKTEKPREAEANR